MTTATTLRPLGARILIKPDKPADRIGSLIIPDSAKKPTDTGVVVSMGPGMLMKDGGRWEMPACKPGDRVIYNARNPFVQIELNGEKLLQMRDDDLLAVIEAE
jgi:co-chaperonin GroES (HSP10)